MRKYYETMIRVVKVIMIVFIIYSNTQYDFNILDTSKKIIFVAFNFILLFFLEIVSEKLIQIVKK